MSATVLYVKNLDPSTTDMDLFHEFARYGSIRSAALAQVFERGSEPKLDHGIVVFFDPASAAKAKAEANGRMFRGRPMEVSFEQHSMFPF